MLITIKINLIKITERFDETLQMIFLSSIHFRAAAYLFSTSDDLKHHMAYVGENKNFFFLQQILCAIQQVNL